MRNIPLDTVDKVRDAFKAGSAICGDVFDQAIKLALREHIRIPGDITSKNTDSFFVRLDNARREANVNGTVTPQQAEDLLKVVLASSLEAKIEMGRNRTPTAYDRDTWQRAFASGAIASNLHKVFFS